MLNIEVQKLKTQLKFVIERIEDVEYPKVEIPHKGGIQPAQESEKAEKYTFLQNNGEDYLIVEHKTGDYSYLGEVYSYYVFRRKST